MIELFHHFNSNTKIHFSWQKQVKNRQEA